MYKNIKKVGLGVCCFDATELLEGILSEIRDLVDYIVIGYQNISYNGDPISNTDFNEIQRLKSIGLINEIIEIKLDSSKKPREQEKDKRNLLIQHCENVGCSHALIIDSDEYYKHNTFQRALETIDENNYEITYCQYINYYHDFQHCEKYPFQQGMYVPFVTKVQYRYNYDGQDFKKPSDPTRRYVRPKKIENKKEVYLVDYYEFPWKDLKMHHLSWIRANIRKKLNNWSSKTVFKNYNDLIDMAVESYNNFNENSEKDQPVKVLFNTADHKVDVYKLPKQYINFNYDIYNQLKPVEQEKKILILILSCNKPEFIKLEDCIRKTWVKEFLPKYKNIQYYFYRSTNKKNIYIEDDVIYVPNDDSFTKTGSKMYEALKYLTEVKKIDYDYFYRSNSSSFVNIPLLNKFISYLDNDSYIYTGNIYAAFWSKFNFYGGGESILLNKKDVIVFLDLFQKFGFKLENIYNSADDNLIFGLFNMRCGNLSLDHTKRLKALGVFRIPGNDFVYNENIFNYICIQVKNFSEEDGHRNFDAEINKFNEILKVFQEKNFTDQDIEKQYNNLISNIDKECYLLPKLKKEHFDWVESLPKDKYNSIWNEYRFSNKKTKEELTNIIKNPPYSELNIFSK